MATCSTSAAHNYARQQSACPDHNTRKASQPCLSTYPRMAESFERVMVNHITAFWSYCSKPRLTWEAKYIFVSSSYSWASWFVGYGIWPVKWGEKAEIESIGLRTTDLVQCTKHTKIIICRNYSNIHIFLWCPLACSLRNKMQKHFQDIAFT